MHVLSVREPVESFNPAGSLLDSKLPKPTDPVELEYSAKIKGAVQSLLSYPTFRFANYDPLRSFGYTERYYGHFCHSRTSPACCNYNKPLRNIMIIGATGIIGTFITRAILDAHSQGHFRRISIYTSERTLIEKVQDICALESAGVEIFVGELDDEKAFKDACKGIDTVVSCVGRAVIEKQINLVTWAEQCRVRRFFPSEYGTDIEYFPNSITEPPHQNKLKVRSHMRRMKRMEYTYLVTGPYSDLYFGTIRDKPEAGGFDVKQRVAYLLGDGNGPVSFTAMNDVGKFVVAALINFNVSRNTTLTVHSFTATPRQIITEYEAQTGEKWDIRYTPLEELKTMEKKAYHGQSSLATVLALRRIWTQGGTLFKFFDDALLGYVDTETLENQVRLNIRKQNGDRPSTQSLLSTLCSV